MSKEKLPKKELIRIVKTKEDEVLIDLSGKHNGRGTYLKKDVNVIIAAKKNKILNRVFEMEVPEAIYEELINMIK